MVCAAYDTYLASLCNVISRSLNDKIAMLNWSFLRYTSLSSTNHAQWGTRMPCFTSASPKLETYGRLRDSHAMPEVVHAIDSLHFSATLVPDSVTHTRCNLASRIPFGILEHGVATSVWNPAYPHCIATTRAQNHLELFSPSHTQNAPEYLQFSGRITLEAHIFATI